MENAATLQPCHFHVPPDVLSLSAASCVAEAGQGGERRRLGSLMSHEESVWSQLGTRAGLWTRSLPFSDCLRLPLWMSVSQLVACALETVIRHDRLVTLWTCLESGF